MRKTMLAVIGGLVLLTAACGDGTTGPLEAERIAADVPKNDAPAADEPVPEGPAGGGMAMCAPGVTDCVDTVVEPDQPGSDEPAPDQPVSEEPASEEPAEGGDEFPTEQAREEARALLGMNEADLPDDVRIARRGDEQFMLTEDYVLGRRTVELDDTDGSGHRVVAVTVELPDGPETYLLSPG